jgi:hypothetical protein
MTDEFALDFTTALKPTKKFKVDGQPYEILTLDHLSPEGEAEVTAQFARFGVLQMELEMSKNVTKGTALAEAVQATRITILTRLTTMPKEVAASLHLTQQVALFEAVAAEDDDDGEEKDVSEPTPES